MDQTSLYSSAASQGAGVDGVANAAHFVALLSANSASASIDLTSQDRNTLVPTLTNNQWNTVLAMFKSFNTQSTSTEKLTSRSFPQWILDAGSSYHMIGDKNLLMNLYDIFPSLTVLPNGTHTNAIQEGTMIFSAYMKLSHVRYVPTCDLISFAQLIEELHCIVTLTNKLYVIQDRASRMVIAVGEERDGVYWLRSTTPTVKSYHASEGILIKYGINVSGILLVS